MSKYWIRPEDGARGTLLLISPEHALRGGPEQTKLVPAVDENADVLLEYTAARMLRRTLMDVGAGRRITAVSGYRPHQEQVKIWEDTMRKEGEKFTRTYVAKPGHSEHESGLAVDLAEQREEIDFIRPEFPRSGICRRFRDMAPYRGFVERYLSGKENVTRIDICYLPLDQWAGKELEWPDNLPALISGTNEGGIVWTRWRERYA